MTSQSSVNRSRLRVDSSDMFAKRFQELKSLIPEAFDADGGFDVEAVKRAIGRESLVEKRFGLTWPGKEDALTAARLNRTPFLLALDRDASRNFDDTQNVFIEADNLAALNLMHTAYAGKVKLIYIDPPYNTGNEFVYEDDFSDPLGAYMRQTGAIDADGIRTTDAKKDAAAKKEARSGRKHTNWLNFMYPRLVLARQMLREDGAIMVACDDNEMANLRLIMNEIFGEENFVATFVWQGGRKNDAKLVSVGHDYMVCFSRSAERMRELDVRWRVRKDGLSEIHTQVRKVVDEVRLDHSSDWSVATQMMKDWYKGLPKDHPSHQHKHYNHIDGYDDRGNLFFPGDISWPGGGGPDYEVLHPSTGLPVRVPSRGWVFPEHSKLSSMADQDRVHFGHDERKVPNLKRYLSETEGSVVESVIYKDRRSATKKLSALLRVSVFDYPKDETVLAHFIEAVTSQDDIVMDFFGGSGSTAHAVWLQNAKDGHSRRFVLATLPEPVAPGSAAEKEGYGFISEITLRRLRLSAKKVCQDNPGWDGDSGFRVFRLHRDLNTFPRPATLEDMEESFDFLFNPEKPNNPIDIRRWKAALHCGFPLNARIEGSGPIRKITAEGMEAWIATPEVPDRLREDLEAAGAERGDRVICIEAEASDSDIMNASNFFNLTLAG